MHILCSLKLRLLAIFQATFLATHTFACISISYYLCLYWLHFGSCNTWYSVTCLLTMQTTLYCMCKTATGIIFTRFCITFTTEDSSRENPVALQLYWSKPLFVQCKIFVCVTALICSLFHTLAITKKWLAKPMKHSKQQNGRFPSVYNHNAFHSVFEEIRFSII